MTHDIDCYCPCGRCTCTLEIHCGSSAEEADAKRELLGFPRMGRGCEIGQANDHEREVALYELHVGPMADHMERNGAQYGS